ncbi:Hyaluronidase [Papilio xuthus]|uniref:Hyaluronidase n=1 Tax=Papilio xuthus TaxID=66420 RepID=A0A194QKB7_PAPXU|nr:Hyaluronidase [Papilio xuthus]
MPTDVTTVRSQKPFNVYWNVPTMQCKSKKIPFTNLYEKYGIIQNANDSFRGEKVTILYDPGLFPALLKNESSGKFKFRNGGVPQEGNITSHLDAFRSTVEKSIPDEKFDGIGIIDFESWRPVFRQNFGVLVPYKDVSVQIEKKLHWWWPNTWLQEEAKDRFEEAARQFMQNTVSVAKQLRPRARWGYYGFPYCFNVATNNPGEACPNNVIRENNQIKWLWSESTALYPSIYSSVNLTSKQLTWLVRGRVSEAARVRGGGGAPILPYFWFRYRDAGFMTQQDLDIVLKTLYKSEASGFIIWGSSNDVNTVNKCNKLQEYVNKILGPAIAKYVKYSIRLDDETTVIPETITERETILTTNNINDTTDLLNPTNITNQDINKNKTINMKHENVEIQIDPFKFSQDTYERNILQEVEDELNKKSEYISDTDDIKDIDKKDDQGLIEIFMNLINSKKQTTREIQTEINTEETLSTRTYITSEVISTTESQIYSTTEINEVNLFDTKYIETTTNNENIEINTETEKSLTTEITEKLDEYTEIIYSTTKLPTSNNLEVTDMYTTNSNEYENLLEKSTNESLDSYDEVTEISILDDLEDKISKNTNEELVYNYTAYSLPSSITDKVVVYIL